MKKIISTFLLISILFGSSSFLYAEEKCDYKSQIEKCAELNKNGSPLAEKDFLCVSEINMERMAYNLILDDKFKEIDEEADEYLIQLENGKSRYFGPEQEEPFLKGVDAIEKIYGKYGYFYNKYKNTSLEVIGETIGCLGGKTDNTVGSNYLLGAETLENFILDKNRIRRQVAYDIMKINKQQVRKDEKKKYVQVKRTQYDIVSALFMTNIGYILRIMFKWSSKTKNPL